MSILSHQSIMRLKPIVDQQERTEVTIDGVRTSYGCGPCGYDLRLAENIHIEPGAFMLASAIERFEMPTSIVGHVTDKSSWARRGILMQNTVIEPGWKGYLTLEITNNGLEAVHLPRGCGICQVLFHWLDEPTDRPYDGKYQNQKSGPQVAL